ncbi:MAG: hypothetical protein PWQ15_1730 [Methanobacterium sp.]|jgi:hypothetical protein|uniref:hypothetical protein n=1 Tax=Methanobacterium sp. TaxID=2164 RepID=UPI0003C9E75F|nr:hypothetical protein [Methanobacterium sp.]MDI3550627.1 hypothetical protein [Methanobacterium sp.]CDG65088.1 putative secreted protein [Methanobacterium sp. MB1]
MLKKLELVLLVVFVCMVVAVSGCMSSTVKVAIDYPGSWNGTLKTDEGTRSIEGTGNQTIDLGSITGSLYVKVEKKDRGSNDTIKLSAIKGDKIVSTMNSSTKHGELDDAILSIHLTP